MFIRKYFLLNEKNENGESFDAANFDFGKLDQADGQSSDINMDALREMGILDDDGSNHDEVEQPEEDDGLEKLGEDASLDDILKELSKNPKQFDQSIEDKLAEGKDAGKDKGAKDSEQPKEKDSKEDFETIVYKGEEKKLSKSELRELAQKGFDYTQKTQEVSKRNLELEEKLKGIEEKEKQIYTKFQEEKTKFETDINEKKQWDFVLNALQKQNPDLFDEIKNFSEELMINYQNPLVQGLIEKVNYLEKSGVEKEDQEIANQYYGELNTLKSTLFPSLEKLGIKVDEEKVKQAWIKGAENVKAATYAIYGDQIRKLQESKLKLTAAKRKASTTKVQAAVNAKSVKSSSSDDKPKRSSYHDITRRIVGY